MKKRKTYEISVIDNTYSKIISDETKFYTSDTALELAFELKETEYNFESAEIVLLNVDDRSLATRPVSKVNNDFVYEIDDDITSHYGDWRGQLMLVEKGEVHVSSPIKFRIENDLYCNKPLEITEVVSWISLKQYANGLIDELKQAVLSAEGIEDTFNTNENVRQITFETNESERSATFNANEDIRQTQESEREKAEVKRQTVFDGNEANRTEIFNVNEATRQGNEDARIEAEQQREETVAKIESRQTTVETQFNSIQQEMTDKDVISAPEIIAARKGMDTLNERLDGMGTIGDINRLETSLNDLQAYVGYAEKGVLGLEADFENNKFTRLGDAVGRTPGASFDGFNMYGGRRRVNLADDGAVNAVFGDGGYTEDGSNGQVMVEQPVFYYKVVPLKTQPVADGHGQNLMKARYYVSDQPRAGFKVHPAFKDHTGKTRQKVYVSAYESTIFDTSEGVYLKLDEQVADFASDKLSSIANAKPASGVTQNLTRKNARKLANNRGQGWHQHTFATAAMSQLLFIIEYASFNTQEKLGSGRTGVADDGATSQTSNTGATQTLGNKSGSVDVDGYAIPTYRGEENLWGNIFSIVDGFTLEGKGVHNGWFALGDYQENGIDGSYKPFGFTIAKASGYVKYFGYSDEADFAFIPGGTGNGANSALPVGDNFYQNNAYDGFLAARLGGSWSSGAIAGLFYWTLNDAFSSRNRIFGARLVYAP